MSKKNLIITILTAIAVLLIAAGAWELRWKALNELQVDYDEDDYLLAAQEYADLIRTGNWKGFTETNYRPEHPPLAKIIFGLSILPLPEKPLLPDVPTTAGPNQYVPRDMLHNARTVSAVFGTAEVLLLGILNPLAGIFLALHTYTIKYTSQVMLEALPAFTSLVAVACYTRYAKLRVDPIKQRRRTTWLIASAAFLGLTAAAKYLYCVVGIAILIDWILSRKDEPNQKRFLPILLLWGGIALLVFFIADPYLWPAPFERLKESILYHATYSTTAQEVQQTGWPFWQVLVWLAQSFPWNQEVFLVTIDLLISLLAIFGFSRMWRKQRVFGLWLIIAIVFLLFWPTKWPQYVLILSAPLCYAGAEGVKNLAVDPINALWDRRKEKREKSHISRRDSIRALPWLIPGLITLTLLLLYPLIYEFAMSMTDFNATSIKDGINGGIWRETWLGLTNQVEPVSPDSNQYASSLTVNYSGVKTLSAVFTGSPEVIVFELLWTVLSVGLQAVLGISLALLLHQRGIRFKALWRTIFLLPWAIPEFVGALIWLRTFDPTVGWVSQAFGTSGGSGGAILISKLLNAGGPNLSLLLLLIAATWIGFPIVMLAASASLRMIPDEVYDAAALDGAVRWPLFRHITWPLLLPLVIPVLIIRVIFAFNQFYLIYVFFPYPQFNGFGTFAYFSYYFFKEAGLYSISAAINVITVVILVILLIIFNRWSKASEGVTYA